MKRIWIPTLLLFVAASAYAYAQRGYFAVGGELFVLMLPLVVKFVRIAIEEEAR